ncbi:hypothetical protein MKW92_026245 [Papaver armeniacum]|nr:hypothetical protein MKW92_026245 [Papaver armeniacum]
MVIIGPKIVPEEEPKSESKVCFPVRWMKEFNHIFNSSDRIDKGGVGTSENKMKKKKKKKNGWNMVRIRRTKQFSSDQEQIRYENGCFEYKQIKAATENFSPANMIGRGGFGPVYKGVLPNKTAIAVKNLSSNSKQGKREFLNEINTISRLRHPNLVTLYGHCAVDNKFLLVYEYMENSCLATALSGSRPNLKERLDWQTRVKICIGIARGLALLHEGSVFRIVHRDIKLSNVLLDKDLNPKIADFGLARLDLEERKRRLRLLGYMAPEYAMRGRLTAKADIYSFGVVILELISGKRCSYKLGDDSPYLLDLAVDLQKKGDLMSLINENSRTGISVKEARMILDLAVLCISCSPAMRPSMSEVVNILEGKTIIKTPHFEAGKYYIECSDEELKVGCNKWENSLVGCFVSESGAFCFDKEVDEDVLRQAIEKASEVASKGNGYSVSFIGNGHFLLQFSSDEDKIRVLETSGLLHIEGKTLVFRKWDWKLKFDKVEMLKSVPVWVKIYNLPLFLWNSSFLSKVGSALGIPICADQTTLKQQRLNYARIYIQVVSSKPLLDTLLISVKGIDYLLNLEYDWKPLRCTYCFTFGHIESKCTMKVKGKQVLE